MANSADADLPKQSNMPVLRYLNELIEHFEQLSRLHKHLGIDVDVIESASVQPRFNVDSDLWITSPFGGRPPRLYLHHWHDLGRHPLTVQSSQDRFVAATDGRPEFSFRRRYRRISHESSTRSSVHSYSMLVCGLMSLTIIWRMTSKSQGFSPGSRSDGSANGLSSTGAESDPQIALAAWLFLWLNTTPAPAFIFAATNPPPEFLLREALSCEQSTPPDRAGLFTRDLDGNSLKIGPPCDLVAGPDDDLRTTAR